MKRYLLLMLAAVACIIGCNKNSGQEEVNILDNTEWRGQEIYVGENTRYLALMFKPGNRVVMGLGYWGDGKFIEDGIMYGSESEGTYVLNGDEIKFNLEYTFSDWMIARTGKILGNGNGMKVLFDIPGYGEGKTWTVTFTKWEK